MKEKSNEYQYLTSFRFDYFAWLPAADPRCVKRSGRNAHPDDCSKFLSCANGTMIAEQRCSDGTLYWPKNESCEFADSVAFDCGREENSSDYSDL